MQNYKKKEKTTKEMQNNKGALKNETTSLFRKTAHK